MPKDTQINMKVDEALKDAAEKAAKHDHRSLTSLIEKLILDYCRNVGIKVREHV